jgi:hypothetical protein
MLLSLGRLAHDAQSVLAGIQWLAFVGVKLRSQVGLRIIFRLFA